MKAEEIEKIIGFLEKPYTDLLVSGAVSNSSLFEIFPDSENVYLEPEEGIEIMFSREDMLFKKLFIILRAVTATMLEYEGGLPGKLKKIIDQDWVHETFGAPKETHGPVKLPRPTGWTGGWDIYDYESALFPGVLLVFKYSADMKVETLVFKKNI